MHRAVRGKRRRYVSQMTRWTPRRHTQLVNPSADQGANNNDSKDAEVSIAVQVPTQKCSLSYQRPFQIGLALTNHSENAMFTPHPTQVRLLSKAYTRGPALQFLDARTNAVVATYRLELCRDDEWVGMVLKSRGAYSFREKMGLIAAGNTVALTLFINEKGDKAEEWCKDLMAKLVKGERYKVRIVDNAGEQEGFQKMAFRVWYAGGADMFGVTD